MLEGARLPLQKLKEKLERMVPQFAYEMIAMEMLLEDDQNIRKLVMSDVAKLMEIYMNGVQVLESVSDPRFSYFYRKIQQLMTRKTIVQQIHLTSTGKKISSLALKPLIKREMDSKKEHHNAQIYYNQAQYQSNRVQQILKTAESKLEAFRGRVSNDIGKQERRLEERLSRRKMKSEEGHYKKLKSNIQSPRNPAKQKFHLPMNLTSNCTAQNERDEGISEVRKEYFDQQFQGGNKIKGKEKIMGRVKKAIT